MKVLLIEDELSLAKSIRQYLTENDFVCEHVNNLYAASEKIEMYEYDCILLDLSLPDGHGFEILKQLKEEKKEDGIIIISAKDTIDTKIKGLQLGADDYLIKPFHLSELLVRIQAVIRRRKFNSNNILWFNELEIDLLSKSVKVKGKEVDLTKTEFELLVFFIGNKNKVLSKSAIAEHLSGDMADMMDRYDFIYAHIKNLKKKIMAMGGKNYIVTIYGLGYKFQE